MDVLAKRICSRKLDVIGIAMFKRMTYAIEKLLPKIIMHPFNQGLASGTLSPFIFRSFLQQDKIYLNGFSICLKKTACRLSDENHQKIVHHLAFNARNTAVNLHGKYLRNSRSSFRFYPPFSSIKPNSIIKSYLQFLDEKADKAHPAEAIGSLMPCFYLYSQLGKHMHGCGLNKHNPFRLWIDSYSSHEFLISLDQLIAMINKMAHAMDEPAKKRIISTFVKSTLFEIEFWNSMMPPTIEQNAAFSLYQV